MSDLDLLIPVYNEGEHIVEVFEALRRDVKTPFRVLVCYDQEEDTTLPAIRRYPHATFEIVLVKNRSLGVHGAVMSGFQASTAPALIVLPADDPYNAGLIDQMVQRFREGCEIVVASRLMSGGRMEGCPWLKHVLMRVANATLYAIARVPTHDATNGFRLFSRRLLQTLAVESTKGFAYSLELLVKCHRLGWAMSELPALWFERRARPSRFRVLAWLPAYLRWYVYAFATTYLRRQASTVKLKSPPISSGAQAATPPCESIEMSLREIS